LAPGTKGATNHWSRSLTNLVRLESAISVVIDVGAILTTGPGSIGPFPLAAARAA
jgi:hypothetical protein